MLGGDTSVKLPCKSANRVCKFFHLDITGEYFCKTIYFFECLEYKDTVVFATSKLVIFLKLISDPGNLRDLKKNG